MSAMLSRSSRRIIARLLPALSITFFLHGHSHPSEAREWFLHESHVPTAITPAPSRDPVIIAVVDDGVRLSHRDLVNFIWTNPREVPDNGIDDDGNGYVDDLHGWDVSDGNNSVLPPTGRLTDCYHGTHLAGIVMQIARETYGDRASDLIRILPVKALSDDADRTYIEDGYKGIAYALSAGADIIICAWGVGHIAPAESQILEQAREKGVLVVASAGNWPEEREQYPAAHEAVLAVAGINQENRKIEHSNYGSFVDLSAPGIDILSTSVRSDTEYEKREGTSQSAAIVAAAAALVQLQHPSYSVEEVVACLKQSAKTIDMANPRYGAKLGAGALNVEAAIECDLLTETIKNHHQLLNPQGYLRVKGAAGNAVTWAITPHATLKGIRFTPRSIRGSTGQSILEFHAGQEAGSKATARHLVAELPESIYIPGSAAHVTLEPKTTDQMDGLLEYRAEAINLSTSYCNGTVRLDVEGTLEDGSGPDDYAFNSNCKWLITAPAGKVIHLRFTEFDTEARTDLLYFFNGQGTHEQIMAIFSGPDLPPELTTWSNQVLIWFVTDGKTQGKGWKAEYRFRDPRPRPDSQPG